MKCTIYSPKRLLFTACLLAMTACLFFGCSGGGGGAPATGTLKVSLTDRFADQFAEVRITIRAIKVVPVGYDENADDDDPGLIDIPLSTEIRSFNVLDLAFVQHLLGTQVLPAGTYSQIRLILEPNADPLNPLNYVVLADDITHERIPLKTPSAQQSGLKVKGQFEVEAGAISAIALDFDPNTAIVERGNTQQNEKYILKPTGIRIVQTDPSLGGFGSVSGTVSATFKDWSSATVAIKRRGAINDSAPIAVGSIFSNYTSGRWEAPFAAFVPPSTEPMYKAFISAPGFRLYSSPAVPVTQGETSSIGEVFLAPLP